jgi:hypothetical protein
MRTEPIKQNENTWHQCSTAAFWGEIAPCDHLVQIYENDEVVLDSLEGFADSGLRVGDSVIIIATAAHLISLNFRLIANGFDIQTLSSTNQYITLNANETLAKFMINGWPDENLFMETVKSVIKPSRGTTQRRIRAYGEMVAILWEQGHNAATVQLEHLWNKFCETEVFCLFCAYPKRGFTHDPQNSIEHICSTHTKVIAGLEKSKTEVLYQRVN